MDFHSRNNEASLYFAETFLRSIKNESDPNKHPGHRFSKCVNAIETYRRKCEKIDGVFINQTMFLQNFRWISTKILRLMAALLNYN